MHAVLFLVRALLLFDILGLERTALWRVISVPITIKELHETWFLASQRTQ